MVAAAAPRLAAALGALTAVQGIVPLAVGCSPRAGVARRRVGARPRSRAAWLAAAAGVAVVAAALSALASVLSERLSETVRDDVAARIHRQSAAVDLAYYEDPSFHDTLHRAQQEGPSGARRGLALGLAQLARARARPCSPWPPCSRRCAVVGRSPPGRRGARPARPPAVFAAPLRAAARPGARRARRRLSRLASDFAAVGGRVLPLGIGSFLQESWATLRRDLRSRRLALSASRSRADVLAQAFAAAALFATFAYLARQAVSATVSIGAFVMYFGAVQRGLQSLATALLPRYAVGGRPLPAPPRRLPGPAAPAVVDPASPRPFPSPLGAGIRVENVTFRYRAGARPALDGISLEIPAGKVVALVGLNGSGKPHLVKLLLRLYDPEIPAHHRRRSRPAALLLTLMRAATLRFCRTTAASLSRRVTTFA